jgi:hypothetical protein
MLDWFFEHVHILWKMLSPHNPSMSEVFPDDWVQLQWYLESSKFNSKLWIQLWNCDKYSQIHLLQVDSAEINGFNVDVISDNCGLSDFSNIFLCLNLSVIYSSYSLNLLYFLYFLYFFYCRIKVFDLLNEILIAKNANRFLNYFHKDNLICWVFILQWEAFVFKWYLLEKINE